MSHKINSTVHVLISYIQAFFFQRLSALLKCHDQEYTLMMQPSELESETLVHFALPQFNDVYLKLFYLLT